MRKCMTVLLVISVLGITDFACAIPYGGIEFQAGEAAFADTVVSYQQGTGDVGADRSNPEEALGIPDFVWGEGYDYVSLGIDGELILQFTDNILIPSCDSTFDLWIYEIGIFESVHVEISSDGTDWLDVGSTTLTGSYDVQLTPTSTTYTVFTSGIDIDEFIDPVVKDQSFSYVKLTDNSNTTNAPYPGADIDAVGASSSAALPVPEPGTLFLLSTSIIGLSLFIKKKKQ